MLSTNLLAEVQRIDGSSEELAQTGNKKDMAEFQSCLGCNYHWYWTLVPYSDTPGHFF